jgi:DNA-binding MarR family transcriptional regulator
MPAIPETIKQIRDFNRFYTRLSDSLCEHVSDRNLSCAQINILYEIEHMENCTTAKLKQILPIDSSYLGRILKAFEKDGITDCHRSPTDGSTYFLQLTATGRKLL